jgi:hypothetical protein
MLAQKKVYDNPPKLSKDDNERLKRGYKWHVEWGWTMKDAVTKSGCSAYVLRKAIAAKGPGNCTSTKGRRELFNAEIVKEVMQLLTEKSMTLETVSLERGNPNSLSALIMERIRAHQVNKINLPKEPSWNTQKKWTKKVLALGGINRKGEVKNQTRKTAISLLRNCVAYASVIRCIFVHHKVHPEMMVTTDDMSVLVHKTMDQKPSLITTKAAKDWLRANGLGVSMSNEEIYKQRMITFKITISIKRYVCVIMLVYDRDFTNNKEKPSIYPMGDHTYVALVHPVIDMVALEYYCATLCIEPEIDILRYVHFA